MPSFFTLVQFEYKKILKRKSTLVSFILLPGIVVFLSLISVTSTQYHHATNETSAFEAMHLDREAIASRAGYIDETLLKETLAHNAAMLENDENYIINGYGRHLKEEAYINYVLPYENVVGIINTVYEKEMTDLATDGFKVFNTQNSKPIDTLAPMSAKDFYIKTAQTQRQYIQDLPGLSQRERHKHFEMLSQIKTPFYNDSYDGYMYFFRLFQVIALILMTVVAIWISPIFADEYQQKTDQLLLASKYGKNKIIYAKFFTGITFSVAAALAVLFSFLLSMLFFHGFGGANAAVQTLNIFLTYPTAMLQASLTMIAAAVFITLLFATFTMFLSACFRSSFLVVTLAFLTLFVPVLIRVPLKDRITYQLVQLLPAKALTFQSIFNNYLFELFGTVFTPAAFYIAFSSIGSVLLLPIAYRTFRNHQIS